MTTRPSMPPWHAPDPLAISPTRAAVQAWLDAYVRAWQSWDPGAIADLWTEDCIWRYPFGVRARGRVAITAEWLAERHLDDDGGYDAHHEPIAIDGDIVVAHGRTRFFDPASGETHVVYDNLWVLRFGPDGRCSEFHEWFAGPTDHGEIARFAAYEPEDPAG
jgi:ketosteroid isomerase-like protein